jgi:DNA-directed RNA polymerase subunit RPC12/RpoP
MREQWDIAGLTDEEGRLRPYLGGGSALWVPPEATLITLSVVTGPAIEDEERIPYLQYPIHVYWKEHLNDGSLGPLDLGFLEQVGWKVREETTGLLEDFVRIAEGKPEKVRRFVLKWGPLWLCRRHNDCFWTLPVPPASRENRCMWQPEEGVHEFQANARQARAAFDIAASLVQNEPAPAEPWRDLGWPFAIPRDLKTQRYFLTWTINKYLSLPDGPRLLVTWPDNSKARLSIYTGLGFFQVAWLQIAQLITGGKSLYVCTGCGKPYIRHKRKPPEGAANYCEECGSKTSKRDYARRKRARASV